MLLQPEEKFNKLHVTVILCSEDRSPLNPLLMMYFISLKRVNEEISVFTFISHVRRL